MKKFFKAFVIFIVIAAVLGGGFYYVFRSKWIFEKYIPGQVNRSLKGLYVSDVHVGEQGFTFPGRFTLKNIDLILTDGAEARRVKIEEIQLDTNLFLLGPRRNLVLELKNLSSSSAHETLEDGDMILEAFFFRNTFEGVKGEARIGYAQRDQLFLENIASKFVGYNNQIRFEPFQANFYGGKIFGEIDIDNLKDLSYIVKMNANGIYLSNLKPLAPGFFSKMQGVIEGSVLLKGNPKRVALLNAQLEAPQGGSVDASLIKMLLESLPKRIQTDEIKGLLASGGDVPLELAKLKLYSLTQERVTANVAMNSRKINLNANVDIDFNVEGGLGNLLAYINQIQK